MDPIPGDSSSNHTSDEQGHPTLGNKPEIEKETPSSSSLSSDGKSSEEEFFQLDAAELDKSFARSTEIANDKLASQSETENGKVTGIDDVVFGPNHSPSLQVMERSDVSDPNGISSSMFARTMSAAIDWSMVSNESLFSIQIGSSSFSRDHVFLMGKTRELINFPMDPHLPSSAEPANAAATQGVLRVNAEKVGSKDKHPSRDMLPSASRMASFRSFKFPVLTNGKSRSIKVGPVKQLQHSVQAQRHPRRNETAKAAPAAKCFPCFSCSFCS